MDKIGFLNYAQATNPEAEKTKDAHVEDGENSFEFSTCNFKP
jgi:hypothetical protein